MKSAALGGEPSLRLRPLLIIGQLLASLALGFLASRALLAVPALLLAAIALVVGSVRWPPLGLIVAIVAGLVVPFRGPSGLNGTMTIVALLLVLWLLDRVGRRHQLRLSPSRPLRPLLAFVVVALVAFVVGQMHWSPFIFHAPLGAQLGGLSIVCLSAAAFFLMANQVRDVTWLRRITWAFLAVAALTLLFRSVLPALGFATRDLFQPVGSVFYVWLVAISFSQAAFNRELHRLWRLALAGLFLVTMWVLFVTKFGDKSGWLSCTVCLVAIIAFRSWRSLLALAPLAAIAAFALWAEVVRSENYSISTRVDALVGMAQMIKLNPLLGLGFANYYWYAPLFPIRGYAVSFNSHNNYVDIMAQMGVVGLLCFTWFLWELGRLAWQLRERTLPDFAKAYVYGAWGGLVGMIALGMFGDWIVPFFYNIGLNGFRTSMLGWLFLGGLVSLQRLETSS